MTAHRGAFAQVVGRLGVESRLAEANGINPKIEQALICAGRLSDYNNSPKTDSDPTFGLLTESCHKSVVCGVCLTESGDQ
jgi:hypothetical protein